MGTTYGGNGQTTFALPDFRGRVNIISLQKGSNTLPLPAIAKLERGAYLLTISTPEQQQSVTILKMD